MQGTLSLRVGQERADVLLVISVYLPSKPLDLFVTRSLRLVVDPEYPENVGRVADDAPGGGGRGPRALRRGQPASSASSVSH